MKPVHICKMVWQSGGIEALVKDVHVPTLIQHIMCLPRMVRVCLAMKRFGNLATMEFWGELWLNEGVPATCAEAHLAMWWIGDLVTMKHLQTHEKKRNIMNHLQHTEVWLAMQWFGNLVVMAYWGELWLYDDTFAPHHQACLAMQWSENLVMVWKPVGVRWSRYLLTVGNWSKLRLTETCLPHVVSSGWPCSGSGTW